jgi:thioredoxin reductase (NADPH)
MSGTHDVVIIGAGPAGLAAAIYSGRARLDTLIIERAMPGGQILLTGEIENYPGFPNGISTFQLMEDFRKQAEKFGAKITMDEVREIHRRTDNWEMQGNSERYEAKAVILATGAHYRKLDLEGEKRLTGRGVSYCATCDGAFFKDKRVAVVGGGDWALTEALFLTRFCREVLIIHRRDEFRAVKILQERAFENLKIRILWDSVVEEVKGEETLKSLILRNVKDETTYEMELDGLFVSIGTVPNSELVRDLVALNEWGEIKVARNMSTPKPGLFAAGDVTDACPQQVATAVGTGVAAAIAVDEYLDQKN